MSKSKVYSGRVGVAAVAACGLVALSACSGGSSTGASSSAMTATTTSTTSTTPSSTSPSINNSVLHPSSSSGSTKSGTSSGTTATTSGKSSKGTKPTTTKSPVQADPVGACLTANKESNAAITQWNAAVASQSKSKLDAAAKKFRTTADNLRKLPAKSQDSGFGKRVKAVAHDLDVMAKARFDGQTVTTSAYNKDSERLRTYCQKLITNA